MATRKDGNSAPHMDIFPSGRKSAPGVRTLSTRDRAVLNFLLKPRTDDEAAAEFKVSRQRIQQIRSTPAASAYALTKAMTRRVEGYTYGINMLVDRLEQAARMGYGVALDELMKAIKLLEPKQETTEQAYEMIYAEAERIADEYGLTGEKRGQFLRFVAERAA